MSMIQKTKKYLIGVGLGVVIGIPIGMNIGKDKPIFSNPFAERNITGQIKDKAKDALSDTKKALREKLQD